MLKENLSKEEMIFRCLKGYVDECAIPAFNDLSEMYDSNPIIKNLIERYSTVMNEEEYYRLRYYKTGEDTYKGLYECSHERLKHYREVFWECIIRNY